MRNQTYSNQNFDDCQALAYSLTDADRLEGKPGTPAFGYSKENWEKAESILANADCAAEWGMIVHSATGK